MIDDAEMLTAVHILFLVESRGGFCKNWDSLVAGPLTFGLGCPLCHLLCFILYDNFALCLLAVICFLNQLVESMIFFNISHPSFFKKARGCVLHTVAHVHDNRLKEMAHYT